MDDGRYRLSASVVLFRGEEILVMKRAAGFASGGWFIPGGGVEQGERPGEAAVREVWEEAQIRLDPGALELVDIMTYETDEGTGHTIIYRAACDPGTECVIDHEHVYSRWMTPEAYIARFLDEGFLRERGATEDAIALANEVARVVRAAAERRP